MAMGFREKVAVGTKSKNNSIKYKDAFEGKNKIINELYQKSNDRTLAF